MIQDTRWQDSDKIPLTNGPVRAVTPPLVPRFVLDSGGKKFEYLVPYPMHIVDPASWVPLELLIAGIPVRIERPISSTSTYEPDGRIGNESPDTFCTILHLLTPVEAQFGPADGWRIAESLIEWIRIKCRHFWLLHGIAGYAALYRGSVLARSGKRVTQQNVAAYRPGFIVRPLSEQIWQSLRHELEDGSEVPLADSLYCDALLSVVAGDEMKALVEAGVAAEVAITQLLLEVSSTQPDSAGKQQFRKTGGSYDRFKEKLTVWPQRLGLEPVHGFTMRGIPREWVSSLQKLYQLRNGVAHAGKLKAGAVVTGVTSSLFAVNTLLEYCRSQRMNMGLRVHVMPVGITPFSQTVAYGAGAFNVESNVSHTQLV